MIFDKNWKVYLFKDKGDVHLSLKVADHYVVRYKLKQSEFEYILDNWNSTEGAVVDSEYHCHFTFEYKTHGPRPERKYSPFVKVAIFRGGAEDNYRLTYDDMILMSQTYQHQKSNKMYWD